MPSVEGYFLLCLSQITPAADKHTIKASIVHSNNINTRYVHINTNSLIHFKHAEPPTIIEMFNPTDDAIMVELFECYGEVRFEASDSLKRLTDNSSHSGEHSKNAGHFVVKLESD